MGVSFAIGVSDFAALINNKATYIDKSLWIKDLFEDLSGVILFPRPRRFGKTLNLSMLRYFLDCRGPKSRALFDHLSISTIPEIMAHQGQYPVIFISLKEIKKASYSGAMNAIALLIQELFSAHKDLYDRLSPEYQHRFDRLLNLNASEEELAKSLHFLSQLLESRYQQKVWILIDEYDTPIHEAWTHDYYEKMKTFMQGFLGSALKDNNALYKSVLTGILRVSKEGLFSDLNNLTVHSMLSSFYGQYFGFTEQEVDWICEQADLSPEREAVRAWYNGYKFGELNIYNPWSIINFAKNRTLEPYWVNTGSSAIIESLISKAPASFKSDFETLIQGGVITKPIDEKISLPMIQSSAVNAVWSFLLFSGYLKVVSINRDTEDFLCEIAIPNTEIARLYQRYFMNWLTPISNPEQGEKMLKALVAGDLPVFEKHFLGYVRDTLSYFDVSGDQPENFYHALVLGILSALKNTHQISSNRESGDGRYDVMIIPLDISKPGIIIEFKVADTEKLMPKAAKEALAQIKAKNYQAELETRGIQKILKLAIVFHGKKVLIKIG